MKGKEEKNDRKVENQFTCNIGQTMVVATGTKISTGKPGVVGKHVTVW